MTRLEPQRQPIRTSLASRAAIVIVTLAAFLLGYMVHRMKIPPYRQVGSAITSAARFG